MKQIVFYIQNRLKGYVNQSFKPKDRVKARVVLDGLIFGWFLIFVLTVFSYHQTFVFYKSVWMLIVLTVGLFCMRLKDYWIVSIHVVSIGILCIILVDIYIPGFTPDILLIQHAFLVIFFSQMVIMNIWGHLYSALTILSIGWIISQRTVPYTFNVHEDYRNSYLMAISFGIILYMMFKNLKSLRNLIGELEHARASETFLYKEIKRVAEKVKFQNDQKILFFSTISHELRTPLNAIVGFANLLKSDFSEQNTPENIKLLHFSTEYLASTVNNVMESNNANYINSTSSESSFDLIEMVLNVYKGFKMKASKKQISLDITYSPELEGVHVIGFADRLMQVIYNLVDNAVKFTKEGSVVIKVLFISRMHSNVEIEFQVQDTGIGIPSQKIRQIYKPYQQASETINREYGGTGLGLTIVEKLVKMMHGEIECESELNVGTIFYFRLKFLIPNYRSTHDITFQFSDQQNLFKGMNVLVAEDNDLNIKLIKRVLEQWDVNFDMAMDGWEAYQMATQKQYDVILMDVNMPRMTGIESAKKIQSINLKQEIIFLTANIQQEVVDEMKNLKVFGYLIKPFKVEDLKGLLYKILHK